MFIDIYTLWFLLIGVLIAGYVILDGYDLGIGILHLFTRDEAKRRAFLRMVGPYWDGNEVWLIVLGASLFAVFPSVYGTLLSGLYLQFFLLLFAIIIRNVAIELRSKTSRYSTRMLCDMCFGIGSLLTALLLGVVAGNFIRGMPINAQGVFTGSFLSVLNPFAILFGFSGLAVFTLHGAVYATAKAPDHLMQLALRRVALWVWGVMVLLFIVVEAIMVSIYGAKWANTHPVLGGISLTIIATCIAFIPINLGQRRYSRAFIASCLLWIGLLSLLGLQMFPRLVPSSINDAFSLTIYNSSSSPYAMRVLLIITALTIPVVIAYSAFVYYVLERKAAK